MDGTLAAFLRISAEGLLLGKRIPSFLMAQEIHQVARFNYINPLLRFEGNVF